MLLIYFMNIWFILDRFLLHIKNIYIRTPIKILIKLFVIYLIII